MYDMKKLAALIKELEEQLVVCMRCGMCQAVCPVFAETGREADVASLTAGFGKNRADRLAHPTPHAHHKLLFKLFDQRGKFFHIVHAHSPMILPGLRMFFGSSAAFIRRE